MVCRYTMLKMRYVIDVDYIEYMTINKDLNLNILKQWLNKYYGWWDSSQKQDELPTVVGAMTLEATRSLA